MSVSVYNLSFAQLYIWRVAQRHPGAAWLDLTLQEPPELSLEQRDEFLLQLYHRHEALRSGITVEGSDPKQFIRDAADVLETSRGECKLPKYELTVHVDEDKWWNSSRIWREIDGTTSSLYLKVHHCFADRAGLDVLKADYNQLAHQSNTPLLTPLQPREFLDDSSTAARTSKSLQYWKTSLQGFPSALTYSACEIDFTREDQVVVFDVSGTLLESLRATSRAVSATMSSVILASAATLAQRYTHQYRFIAQTLFSNRTTRERAITVANLVQMLYLPLDYQGRDTVIERLRQTQSTNMRSHMHAEFDMQALEDWMVSSADASGAPLRTAFASYHQRANFAPEGPPSEMPRIENGEFTSWTPFELRSTEHNDRLEMRLRVQQAISDVRSPLEVFQDFAQILEWMTNLENDVKDLTITMLPRLSELPIHARSRTAVDLRLMNTMMLRLDEVIDADVSAQRDVASGCFHILALITPSPEYAPCAGAHLSRRIASNFLDLIRDVPGTVVPDSIEFT